jgi:hypothetical protein
MKKDQEYRIIDALYRIHEDIFHLEDILTRFAKSSLSATNIRTNTAMGSLVAGFLVIVPILNTIASVKWLSVPAVVIYVISSGLITLWGYQVLSAQQTAKQLGLITRQWKEKPLETRHDYLIEVIASWGMRFRVIEEAILELESSLDTESKPQKKAEISEKINRFKINRDLSHDWIVFAVKQSEKLLKSGDYTQEEHDTLLDWAKPFV